MDLTIIAIFGKSYSIEVYPNLGIAVSDSPGDQVSPFGNIFGLSIGYVVVMLIAIPMGFFRLDNNIIIQNCTIYQSICSNVRCIYYVVDCTLGLVCEFFSYLVCRQVDFLLLAHRWMKY